MAPPPPSLLSAAPLHPATLTTLALINAIAQNNIDSPLLDDILELSLTCIYEERPPASLRLWIPRLEGLRNMREGKSVVEDIEELVAVLRAGGLDALHGWLNQIKALCPWTEDEETSVSPPPLHRTSPLALYVRRSRMAFFKLSFDEAVRWISQWEQWCEGHWSDSKDVSYSLSAARAYGKARTVQDYQAARDATSFYDADDGLSTQGKAEYALLNTAFLEFEAGGLQTAREALTEAIKVARQVGDARCLVACSSLSRRLDMSDPSTPSTSKLPSLVDGRVSPTDLLWQIKRSLLSGEYVPDLFVTLTASRSLYQAPPLNSASKGKGRFTSWNDAPWESSFHALSAALWSELGSTSLEELRNGIALKALDGDTNVWDVRLAVLSRQAALLSMSSRFDEALILLFRSVDTAEKRYAMGTKEFTVWREAVWDVMRVATARRGQGVLLDGIDSLASMKREGTGEDAKGVDIAALLQEGRELIDQGQPTTALSFFLRALHASSSRQSTSLRLRSLIAVANCRLYISPTPAEARRTAGELDGIWGQVLSLGERDLELLAMGLETRGRALVLTASGDDETIATSLPFFQQACDLYAAMELTPSALRVLSTIARLSDHLSLSPLPNSQGYALARNQAEETCVDHVTGTDETQRRAEEEGWKRIAEVGAIVGRVQQAVWDSLVSPIS